ncbi:hypothetical protein EST38_g9900 [Candolleomyces aberdarensis]|uniref:Uncharacterized protein n=1 Tax=Candolleomyces aberdarensis TaxID=2316362 RepID=A0A4Q2DC22_9AGAR|nr:hypothetical protein EST38_g9900 [Candolleomyces aberdarensis]
MQELNLTPGTFSRLQATHAYVSSSCWSAKCSATVQVTALEKFESASLIDYMICISDGTDYVYGKLHPQLHHLVEQEHEDARVRIGSVVVLQNVNVYQVDRVPVLILVVGALRVLGHAPETIGKPKRLKLIQPPEIDARPSRIWTPNYNCRIRDLSPHRSKWRIRARVTHRSELLSWTKARPPVDGQQRPPRQGKLFTFTLTDAAVAMDLPLDSDSKDEGMDSIRAVAYNLVADKFYPLIEEGKVYHLSNAQIRVARKDYPSDPSYEYELHLHSQTAIEAVRTTFTTME